MTTKESDIDTTLAERGERYGEFLSQSAISQDIKFAMRGLDGCPTNWNSLSSDQKESLEMIANKLGRILNGDPNYHDNWHDIAGYSKLVADRLLGNIKKDTALNPFI